MSTTTGEFVLLSAAEFERLAEMAQRGAEDLSESIEFDRRHGGLDEDTDHRGELLDDYNEDPGPQVRFTTEELEDLALIMGDEAHDEDADEDDRERRMGILRKLESLRIA